MSLEASLFVPSRKASYQIFDGEFFDVKHHEPGSAKHEQALKIGHRGIHLSDKRGEVLPGGLASSPKLARCKELWTDAFGLPFVATSPRPSRLQPEDSAAQSFLSLGKEVLALPRWLVQSLLGHVHSRWTFWTGMTSVPNKVRSSFGRLLILTTPF